MFKQQNLYLILFWNTDFFWLWQVPKLNKYLPNFNWLYQFLNLVKLLHYTSQHCAYGIKTESFDFLQLFLTSEDLCNNIYIGVESLLRPLLHFAFTDFTKSWKEYSMESPLKKSNMIENGTFKKDYSPMCTAVWAAAVCYTLRPKLT